MGDGHDTPVLVGVGQTLQRFDDPREAPEPLEMMLQALERAGADARAPKLLERADAIYVLRGAWSYGDPGREIARRIGAQPEESVGTPYGGNFSQACVIDAARAIQAGRRSVALITGAENGRSQGQAQRQGLALRATDVPGIPDRLLGDNKAIFHDAEVARGMNSASDMYAIVESAIRASRGETLDAHAERIAGIWSGFSAVARDNPNAWIRKPWTAEEIRRAGPDNPMISYPYTRLMNANARVDMGAALILCSLAIARSAGVPEEKLVYLHAATEANDSTFASTRAEFHRSPAMRIAGGRALELAGKSIGQIDHVDLYSCFPSAVEVAAAELGLAEDRPLTVTGGLTFGGGPLNSYVLHAIARMVEVLRDDRGSTGLVSANGGWLAKHAFGIYSTEPPQSGFRYENLQEQVDALPLREAVVDWDGPVTVEAYTVACRAGAPRIAHAACLTDDGRRTWASVDDPAVMRAMTREEFCGRRARIDGAGHLSFDTGASASRSEDGRALASILAALCAGAAALALVWWLSGPDPGVREAAPPAPTAAAAPAEAAPTTPGPAPPEVPDGELVLVVGDRLEIEAAALAGAGSVALNFALPVPAEGSAALPVRIVAAADGRAIDAEAQLQRDGSLARIEIDRAWLAAPGSYLLQVETTEKSHFPVRRYVLVVR